MNYIYFLPGINLQYISGGQVHPANQLCPFYEGAVVRW